jgi:hypothetical protein
MKQVFGEAGGIVLKMVITCFSFVGFSKEVGTNCISFLIFIVFNNWKSALFLRRREDYFCCFFLFFPST